MFTVGASAGWGAGAVWGSAESGGTCSGAFCAGAALGLSYSSPGCGRGFFVTEGGAFVGA